jgi:hypothetical protein
VLGLFQGAIKPGTPGSRKTEEEIEAISKRDANKGFTLISVKKKRS